MQCINLLTNEEGYPWPPGCEPNTSIQNYHGPYPIRDMVIARRVLIEELKSTDHEILERVKPKLGLTSKYGIGLKPPVPKHLPSEKNAAESWQEWNFGQSRTQCSIPGILEEPDTSLSDTPLKRLKQDELQRSISTEGKIVPLMSLGFLKPSSSTLSKEEQPVYQQQRNAPFASCLIPTVPKPLPSEKNGAESGQEWDFGQFRTQCSVPGILKEPETFLSDTPLERLKQQQPRRSLSTEGKSFPSMSLDFLKPSSSTLPEEDKPVYQQQRNAAFVSSTLKTLYGSSSSLKSDYNKLSQENVNKSFDAATAFPKPSTFASFNTSDCHTSNSDYKKFPQESVNKSLNAATAIPKPSTSASFNTSDCHTSNSDYKKYPQESVNKSLNAATAIPKPSTSASFNTSDSHTSKDTQESVHPALQKSNLNLDPSVNKVYKCDFCESYSESSEVIKSHLVQAQHLSASSYIIKHLYNTFSLVHVEKMAAIRHHCTPTLLVTCPNCCELFDDIFLCGLHYNLQHKLMDPRKMCYSISPVQSIQVATVSTFSTCLACQREFLSVNLLFSHWMVMPSHVPFEVFDGPNVAVYFKCMNCERNHFELGKPYMESFRTFFHHIKRCNQQANSITGQVEVTCVHIVDEKKLVTKFKSDGLVGDFFFLPCSNDQIPMLEKLKQIYRNGAGLRRTFNINVINSQLQRVTAAKK